MKLIFFVVIVLLYTNVLGQTNDIPNDKPKLIVGIVVEQMRQDYLTRYWDDFSNDGFKKLAIYGAWCQNNKLNYSISHSSPGFATIVTGAEPTEHGIVADLWYNTLSDEINTSIGDKRQTTIGGKANKYQFSPKKLLCTSMSDEIKLYNRSTSKVFSLGLDPKGAVLSGGFSANAAFWFDTDSGNWVSSSYYTNALPNWVKEFNDKNYPADYLTRSWELTLPESDYNESLPDANLYEYGINGYYKTFPYDYQEIIKDIRNYELINLIPEGNNLTTDFAVSLMLNENLGKDNDIDFLFINYSVNEEIGKLYGPNAMETQDLYIKLDKDIAHLITVIEENIGKHNVLIYLTSNCGVSNNPTYLIDNKLPAGNFKHHYIKVLLESYLKALYGEGNWIKDFTNNQIYFNRTLIEDSKIDLQELRLKAADFIMNSEGVSYALTADQLAKGNYSTGMKYLMQNSYHPKRSGDIIICLKSGWLNDISYSADHISGYNYDTHIPLIWYGWKIKKQIITRTTYSKDIVPSIATMLNFPVPTGSTGTPIFELYERK
ncbi:MAG TPA: alkaline phosphatase family protein [Bacteroidales bacterium]|jgi:hypothetical protein|nr:alkaline phosphatase family protein [Bacteroidales bacterium]HRW21403.1 alkaline phosphatase family protein [Bacteroidales bacterium]